MYFLHTTCYCGSTVLTENLKRHYKSHSCLRKSIRRYNIESEGTYALFQCCCGMIIAKQQIDPHEKGSTHLKLMDYISKGYPICLTCGIPFKSTPNSHFSSKIHEEFSIRKSQLKNQLCFKERPSPNKNENE